MPTIMPAACPWTPRNCAGSAALRNVAIGMGLAVTWGGVAGIAHQQSTAQQLAHLVRRASMDFS